MPPRPAALKFIFVTLLLDVLGFGLLIPVAPKLVMELQGGGEGEAAIVVGWLVATYALMQFFFAPLLGTLSDRFGRRPVLLFSIFGSGLDYFAMALAPTLTWLFVTRLINGITGASMTVASAYIADVTPPEKRSAAFGMMGAAFGIGFVLGPLIGGLLGEVDIRYPFYLAGALTLVNWLYGYFVLPESLPRNTRRSIDLTRANPVGAYAGLARVPRVAGLAAATFLLNLAQFSLHATWVLYTAHRYGWSPAMVGWSLFAVGVSSAIVQGGLARAIIPRLGEGRAVLVGVFVGAMGYAGYALASEGWMIFVVIALASLGGIAAPAAQAIITKSVAAGEQGTVQGALTSLQSIAQVIGPLVGTRVFALSIAPDSPVPIAGLVFLLGSALAVAGLCVAWWTLARFGTPTKADNPPAVRAS